MATIIITTKDSDLFTRKVGVIETDLPRAYFAKISTGDYIRAEMEGTEQSDLFNPTLFSEIEIDGTVYATVNDTVSALNAVIGKSNSSAGGGSSSSSSNLEDADGDALEINADGSINFKIVEKVNIWEQKKVDATIGFLDNPTSYAFGWGANASGSFTIENLETNVITTYTFEDGILPSGQIDFGTTHLSDLKFDATNAVGLFLTVQGSYISDTAPVDPPPPSLGIFSSQFSSQFV